MPPWTTTHGPPATPHDRLCNILDRIQSIAIDEGASPTLLSTIAEAQSLTQGYDAYCDTHSTPPPPIVNSMVENGNAVDWESLHQKGVTKFRLIPEMSAGGYEGTLLAMLARMSNAVNVLEIGMFTGTTTVSIASVPSVTRVVALDIEPHLETLVKPFFEEAGISHKIVVRIGDAAQSLRDLASSGEVFNMVFIDADKGNYLTYYKSILDTNLLAPGGFIAVDNTAFKGAPWAENEREYPEGKAIHEFNRTVRLDDRVDVVMLAIEDGLSLIRRKGE
ncbi:hypothetical protein HGRIS_013470 [Hohenbuehelia grisea]|uniref:Caffeoyl-CoA O-methyltransferase n=1 Tax=Hohenbuehelia grisea TaxID=104357 RepID=A0ABR3IVT3_9AGAR